MAAQAGRAGDAVGVVSTEAALSALAPDVSPALREAIASGCCTYFYVAEGMCGTGGCGSGKCCYHVVSPACGIDKYECLNYSCSKGDFSTGC